ncbi:MAG: ABC transporter ATP-binding protein [Anaerolineaceae bacterium]|nr:ABC transporter ATP-binding protein [Anaerolineaceae bacterium]
MEAIVRVDQLSYRYGECLAVDRLCFESQPGEVLGLLGPNGAGKTTTVRLLNGLLVPASGQLTVMGLDPVSQGCRLRRHTGVLTETPALYERLTARQNLNFFGVMAGMESPALETRIAELLAFFELTERANQRISAYSKGMKQRLALARALLHRPKILFLDEPTSGLDPEASRAVHELIESICRQNGQTVLLCTHNLHEAQRLCDRLVILDRGQLLAFGSMDDLRQQFVPGLWVAVEFLRPLPSAAAEQLLTIPGVVQVKPEDKRTWTIRVENESVVPSLASYLVAMNAALLSLMPRQVSLEEIYFKLQRGDRFAHQEVQHEY